MSDHLATTLIMVLHIVLSLFRIYISDGNKVINLLAAESGTYVSLNVIFLTLFSGLEVSIGRNQLICWMLWSTVFSFSAHYFLEIPSSGPAFLVFSQYLSFIFIHKPFLYFRISKFRFSDSLLYSIAIIQYMLNDFTVFSIDFVISIGSNIIWRLVIKVSHCQHSETSTNSENSGIGQQLELDDDDN